MKETDYIRDLTVGEFTSLMRAVLAENADTKHTVRGLEGLADLLGCSTSTVKRYYPLLKPAIARHRPPRQDHSGRRGQGACPLGRKEIILTI